jgi:hypothetical protein
MYFEDVAKRLFDAHGKSLKLIFIFRNPVDRAFSHYLMSKRRLKEELSFEDAIAQEEVRVVHNYQSKTDFSYISRGFYAEQVKRFLKYFPIENIFFIRFEDDFILNRKEVIQELLQFLNIENIDLDVNLKSNKAKEAKYPLLQSVLYGENFIKKPLKLIPKNAKNKLKKNLEKLIFTKESTERIHNQTRKKLIELYLHDIIELEKIIGKDLSSWYK